MESKKNKKTAPAASFSRKEHVRGPTGFLYSSVDLQPDLKIRSVFERGQVLPLSPHRPAEHLIPKFVIALFSLVIFLVDCVHPYVVSAEQFL